jgi:hypothetical protein
MRACLVGKGMTLIALQINYTITFTPMDKEQGIKMAQRQYQISKGRGAG